MRRARRFPFVPFAQSHENRYYVISWNADNTSGWMQVTVDLVATGVVNPYDINALMMAGHPVVLRKALA